MTNPKQQFETIDRHYHPPGLRLTLDVDGATKEDLERGINAAKRVFMLAELSSYAAAFAAGWQEAEDPEVVLTSEEFEWAAVWRDAEQAALQAACSEMPAGEKTYSFSQTWGGAPELASGNYIRATTWACKKIQE